MSASDSPVFHSFAGPIQLDVERDRSLAQGETQPPTFSDPAPHQAGVATQVHRGNTITDLQDLVERHDLAPFVRLAFAEYLRANHLPQILFYELSSGQQAHVLARARYLRERRVTSGHEGAVE